MSEDFSNSLVNLDSLASDPDVEILPNFPATVEGRRVWVTAVLDRTVVVEPAPGEPKVLVLRTGCLVDPGHVRLGAATSRDAARRGREAARRNRHAA